MSRTRAAVTQHTPTARGRVHTHARRRTHADQHADVCTRAHQRKHVIAQTRERTTAAAWTHASRCLLASMIVPPLRRRTRERISGTTSRHTRRRQLARTHGLSAARTHTRTSAATRTYKCQPTHKHTPEHVGCRTKAHRPAQTRTNVSNTHVSYRRSTPIRVSPRKHARTVPARA